MHAVPKGFVLHKVAYILKVVCLTDFFLLLFLMNLESAVNVFWCFVLFVKNILFLWKLTYETMSYVGDTAQEGQGFIDASSRIE